VDVFREVRRVLKNDGVLWLNLGDSYAASGGLRSGGSLKQRSNTGSVGYSRPSCISGDIKSKDLIGIPWMVAFALRADGWYLRSDIIWHKPNPMPESVTDRPTKSHEYMFLLSKGPKYFYDADAVAEPAAYLVPIDAKVSGKYQQDSGRNDGSQHRSGGFIVKARPSAAKGSFHGKTEAMAATGQNAFRAVRATRNRRSVWTISTRPYKGAHFATFPPKLIEPCILAGSRPGDVVLDPFAGACTTGLVAQEHGRQFLGIELNPAYVKLGNARLKTATVPQKKAA
jgi:DNA modification methylase